MNKRVREKIMRMKWESLRKRGITPPNDKEEKLKRLKEAHGG